MLESFGHLVRRMFASFRDSMSALFDSRSTADDLRAVIWLASIGLVVVVVLWIMRGFEKRKPMR
jgi:hypothetical protein